ncbi:MAG: chorismate mutase [Spirochaetia bacterium]|nr:chorismate mutase [Spirochaetia bacterium]
MIWRLIGRVQFHHNPGVYEAGGSGFENELTDSLFDVRLRYQEQMDAVFGRYTVPEERPYCGKLPSAQRKANAPAVVFPIGEYNLVNLMAEIVDAYCEFVPKICRPGSDGHYGSTVEYDVFTVQALGRRIHYGAFYVSERKYRDAPDFYRDLIESGDAGAVMSALMRPEVEEKILRRVGEKAAALQACKSPSRAFLQPEAVSGFFRDVVIPLTREGEVLYLMNRSR